MRADGIGVPGHDGDQLLDRGEGAEVLAGFLAEMLRGLCFGFGLCLWFIGAEICAAVWGHLSGISIDAFVAEDRRPWTRFFQLVWISVFLLTGSDRTALRALLDSFQWAPPGAPIDAQALLQSVLVLLGLSLQLGLQVGIPLATTLLAALCITVLTSRLIPHLQSLVTSTSLGALMFMAALAVGCGPIARTLELQLVSFLATWGNQLAAAGQP